MFTEKDISQQMKFFINSFNNFSLNEVKYFLQKCQQSQITLPNEILNELIGKCQDKFDQDLIIMLFMSCFNVIQINQSGTLSKIFSKTKNDVKINFELLKNIFSRVYKETLNDEDLKQVLLRCLPTFRINRKLFLKIFECCLDKSLANDTMLLLLKQTDDKAIWNIGDIGKIFFKFSDLNVGKKSMYFKGYPIEKICEAPTTELLKELFRCNRWCDDLGLKNITTLINGCEGKFDLNFVEKLFKFVREDDIIFYDDNLSTFLSKCVDFEMDYDLMKNFFLHSRDIPCSDIYDFMDNFLNKCENGEERFDNDLFVCVLNLCRENDFKAKFFRRLVNILMNNGENKKQIYLSLGSCKCLRNGFLDVETLSYLLDCGFYFSKRVFEENLNIFANGLFEGNFPDNLTCNQESKNKFASTYNDWSKEKQLKENQKNSKIKRPTKKKKLIKSKISKKVVEPVPRSIITEDLGK